VDSVSQVDLEVDPPNGPQGRLVTLFRGLMCLPHYLCLLVLGIGALIAIVLGWFGVLFTGSYPTALFDYIVGVQRWATRVQCYYYLLTDQYPPFSMADDPSYPVRLNVSHPGHVGRWRCIPGVTYLFAIPALIGAYIFLIGALICTILAWLSIMFTRHYPTGFFAFVRKAITWILKVQLYIILINTTYQTSPEA
jgi:hypothetical protein